MPYPEWVEKCKRPGTNISFIRGKYYLYEATSVWNKEKGRAQKKTGKYLGRITEEDGLVPPRKKDEIGIEENYQFCVKEYGASYVLEQMGKRIHTQLHLYFPQQADTVFVLAVLRVIERCPFKRAAFLYEQSFLSERYGRLALSGASISSFLRILGEKRDRMVSFMQEFVSGTEHILFDGTRIISKSKRMNGNRKGYNSRRQFDPQINLLYAFSTEQKCPVYYRVVPGNIPDVSAFRKTVNESGFANMIVIGDKGFGSETNFAMLEEAKLKYIIPLRRNNGLFRKDIVENGSKAGFDGYFLFNGRTIWHHRYEMEEKKLFLFLDSDLRNEEEHDYISRIESGHEGYTLEGFMDKQSQFGTILFRSNLDIDALELYSLYKGRCEIEQSFDFLKNLLSQDSVYLQDDRAMEAWAFINHVSLMLTYELYNRLRMAGLLAKYSVADLISHLKYIHKLKIHDRWLLSEVSRKTTKLLEQLNIPIT